MKKFLESGRLYGGMALDYARDYQVHIVAVAFVGLLLWQNESMHRRIVKLETKVNESTIARIEACNEGLKIVTSYANSLRDDIKVIHHTFDRVEAKQRREEVRLDEVHTMLKNVEPSTVASMPRETEAPLVATVTTARTAEVPVKTVSAPARRWYYCYIW